MKKLEHKLKRYVDSKLSMGLESNVAVYHGPTSPEGLQGCERVGIDLKRCNQVYGMSNAIGEDGVRVVMYQILKEFK